MSIFVKRLVDRLSFALSVLPRVTTSQRRFSDRLPFGLSVLPRGTTSQRRFSSISFFAFSTAVKMTSDGFVSYVIEEQSTSIQI